jgi:colanic acid/amylovoran biosynthesis protein
LFFQVQTLFTVPHPGIILRIKKGKPLMEGRKWMKQIMIHAYTRFNFGDDLLVDTLCRRYPDTAFILPAPTAYKRLFKHLENIRIQPNDRLLHRGIRYLFRKLRLTNLYFRILARNCDAVVHIGGSLFIQQANWKKNIQTTKAMRIKGKPFFLIGANFGPYSDDAFYQQHKNIFQTDTDICFREKHSYELFKELSNVRLADDIGFQMKKVAPTQQDKAIVISVIKPSIRKHLSGYDGIYYQKIQEIAVYFIQRDYQVILLSFCDAEQDNEAIEHIMQGIPPAYSTHIHKHFYQTNIKETLQHIARSQFVVATRFHAMIAGWVLHKPVFPIIYSDKMSHVLEDVGFQGGSTDFAHLHELEAEQVFNQMGAGPMDVSKQVNNAARQFCKLDQFLGK